MRICETIGKFLSEKWEFVKLFGGHCADILIWEENIGEIKKILSQVWNGRNDCEGELMIHESKT